MTTTTHALSERISSLSGHPLHQLLQDQMLILARVADHREQGVAPGDPLFSFETELMQWEEEHLGSCVARWLDVIEGNLQRDSALENPSPDGSSPERAVLSVRDFGAIGDGVQDDAPAIREAIAAAAALGGGATLRIPAGRYRLVPAGGEPAHLVIEGASDIILEGEAGAELIGTAPLAVLRLEWCRNVRLRKLTLDLDPHHYTQGQVLAVAPDGAWVDWKVDEGFGGPDAPHLAALETIEGIALDAATGHMMPRPHDSFTSARREPLGGGVFRLHAPEGQAHRHDVRAGVDLLLYKRLAPMGFEIRACEWIDCEEIAVHAALHFAAYIESSCGVSFRRCALEPRAGRHGGLNADGFHCRSNRFGPFFEECRIVRVLDDCFNLYSRGACLDATAGERTVVLDAAWGRAERRWAQHPRREDYEPGDILAFLNPQTGEVLAHARIAAIRAHDWNGHTLIAAELDRALPPLPSRESLGHSTLGSATFLNSAYDEEIETFVINVSTKCDGFVIRGCALGDNTVTGGKIKASNGLIEGNHGFRHGWCCFAFSIEGEWLEGYAARNVLVRANRFESWFGLFLNEGLPARRLSTKNTLVRRIDIVDNDFIGVHTNEPCVDIRNGCDCSVTGNTMSVIRPIMVSALAQRITIHNNRPDGTTQVEGM
jgi:hypothetical protein